jgi:uncharacterized protein
VSSVTTPVFLDVAIPMYAVGASHPLQAPCQWIMKQIALGQLAAVTDTEVIQETLHRYGSQRRFAQAASLANDLLALAAAACPMLDVTVADVQTAVALFARYAPLGVPSRDLIHAAVMQNHGLTHIISPDSHFDLITGITRMDPTTLYVQAGQPTP